MGKKVLFRKQTYFLNTFRTIKLIPPRFSPEYIKEKIICIRAHRERIFRVSTEVQNGKLICHNYGQGGAGWTFLFGCVHESIRQFEQHVIQNPEFKNKQIAVIGAGCYGLLTAVMLARAGYAVKIFAKEIENIASYKAAGFFFPRARKCSTPEETNIFLERGIESYRTYQQIIAGKHEFIRSGPKLLPGYYGHDIDPGFAPYISQGLLEQPEKVIIDFGADKKYHAIAYNVIFINSAEIMRELQRTIAQLGIQIYKTEITAFSELPEHIIFNCAGLGAQKLTGDTRIVPVQGHLITLKNQPDISQLHYMINMRVTMTNQRGIRRDELIYFAPKESGILGITFLRGSAGLTDNLHEFDRLFERCADFFGV